jgi:hypothetical protein
MTVAELLSIEITKTERKLNRLKTQLPNATGSALRICPSCKTENYHYYADTDSWCCAFC